MSVVATHRGTPRADPHTGPRPLRVMFVTTDMTVGGHEQVTAQVVLGMDRSRFDPIVCCLKELGSLGEQLRREGIPVFSDLLVNKFDARVLVRLIRLMRRNRVDLVCTVGTGGDRMFWGCLAARMAHVPRVVSALHSMGAPDHVEWANRLLLAHTDAFVAVARVQKRYLCAHEGIPSRRTHVVYNGVAAERWVRAAPDPVLARSVGLEPGAPVAGIVAMLRREKNVEMFLRAAAKTAELVPDAHFLVVGDGPRREDLARMTHEWGLAGRVHFVGQRDDVPDLMALMDVLVLSSRFEAFPMVILEGMAAGKPIVSTHVGAVQEAVRHDQNGYLVPVDDVDAMARCIARVLTDRALGRRLGLVGQRLVAERFHLRHMVAGYERLFLSLVEDPMSARVPVGSV